MEVNLELAGFEANLDRLEVLYRWYMRSSHLGLGICALAFGSIAAYKEWGYPAWAAVGVPVLLVALLEVARWRIRREWWAIWESLTVEERTRVVYSARFVLLPKSSHRIAASLR